MKTININSILGSELRSRSSVQLIKPHLQNDDEFELNMDGVVFMSRSFADELCELESCFKVIISNTTKMVSDMLALVKDGRSKARVRKTDNTETVDCEDMDSLSRLLETMNKA